MLDRMGLGDYSFQLLFFFVGGETEAQQGRVSGPRHHAAEQETETQFPNYQSNNFPVYHTHSAVYWKVTPF